MKKTLAILLSLALLLGSLAGCQSGQKPNSSQGTSTPASDTTPPPEADPGPEEATINVIYHPTIGGSTAIATAVTQGFFEEQNLKVNLQMYTSGPPEVAAMVAGQAEFGFIGSGAAWLAFSGQVDIIALDNIALTEQIIARSDAGITTPADLKGLKIRVMSSPVFIDMYTTLGANATPMSFSELFTGLQQNTVEGQENPPTLIYASGFQQVQKYLTIDNHVHNFLPILTNEAWFNGLSAEDQAMVKECAADLVTNQRKIELEDNETIVEKLEGEGMEVNYLTDEEYQQFVDAVQPMYEKYQGQWGTEIFDLATSFNG